MIDLDTKRVFIMSSVQRFTIAFLLKAFGDRLLDLLLHLLYEAVLEERAYGHMELRLVSTYMDDRLGIPGVVGLYERVV